MNDTEFFLKVLEMRKVQKQYFKFHGTEDLRLAKALEKDVDDFLAAKFKKPEPPKNLELF